MKKIAFWVLGFLILSNAGAVAVAQEDVAAERHIAYYFHGSYRCHTCTTVERYIKEAIEGNFKEALASGSLEFKAVNVEARENEHFVKDYRLYTKALVLSRVRGGRETASKNLERIWEYSGDRKRFDEYVVTGISDFLKEGK